MSAPAIETVPHWDIVECRRCGGMPDPDCSECLGTGDVERRIDVSRCCGAEVSTCGQCGEEECGCTSFCTCEREDFVGMMHGIRDELAEEGVVVDAKAWLAELAELNDETKR